MGRAAALYEEDLVRWSTDQAEALRAAAATGTNLPLDWENLAEEIESLGRSEGRELKSRIATIVEHLLKLQHATAIDPRAGWADTIRRERNKVEDLLDDSPSLRSRVPDIVSDQQRRTAELALSSLEAYGAISGDLRARLKATVYAPDQVLGHWLPDHGTSERDQG